MNNETTLLDPLAEITDQFLSNPYPTLAKMRAEAPVFWSDKGRYWVVTRYSESKEILSSLKYKSAVHNWQQMDAVVEQIPELKEAIEFHKHWILNIDPPNHTRLKSLLGKAFTPDMVSQMRPRIQAIADELLDCVEGKNEMNAIADYAYPLPIIVIAEMLGVPASDRDKFKYWSHRIVQATSPQGVPEPGTDIDTIRMDIKARLELVEYLKPLVDERRKNPRQDFISALVQAEEAESKLTQEELLANLVLLLVAGHETTTNLIGNGIYNLLKHPDQLELLKQKPDLIDSAVNEILRFEGPVQLVRRFAGEDIEINGMKIKAGEMIIVLVGAANRDPSEFDSPDKFDITRGVKKHLAFGHGIHHCAGAALAELEGQIALSTVFRRLPNLKLQANSLHWQLPFALRGITAIPVAF